MMPTSVHHVPEDDDAINRIKKVALDSKKIGHNVMVNPEALLMLINRIERLELAMLCYSKGQTQ
jgi:hypothetical protein